MYIQITYNSHTDQRNRAESPDIKPHAWDQLIHDKGAKYTQEGKGRISIS